MRPIDKLILVFFLRREYLMDDNLGDVFGINTFEETISIVISTQFVPIDKRVTIIVLLPGIVTNKFH
jgi:hypothetical protein